MGNQPTKTTRIRASSVAESLFVPRVNHVSEAFLHLTQRGTKNTLTKPNKRDIHLFVRVLLRLE